MTSKNARRLKVEIWSDLTCPWCWLGIRRFERALEQFEHAGAVEVIRRAYRLEPGQTSPVPVDAMLVDKYGLSPQQVAASLQEIERTGATEGLVYRFDGALSGDTLDGHRLIKLAATVGLQREVAERFFRGYFSEHVSLFDRTSLLRLAIEAGLDETDVSRVLSGDAYRAEVEADQQRAQMLGIRGVPFFLLGERYGISGAQPPEAIADGLKQAWVALPDENVFAADASLSCGQEGCAIPRG